MFYSNFNTVLFSPEYIVLKGRFRKHLNEKLSVPTSTISTTCQSPIKGRFSANGIPNRQCFQQNNLSYDSHEPRHWRTDCGGILSCETKVKKRGKPLLLGFKSKDI